MDMEFLKKELHHQGSLLEDSDNQAGLYITLQRASNNPSVAEPNRRISCPQPNGGTNNKRC